MLNLTEYRHGAKRLADWLPWAALVAPGIVLNKDGSFQRSARVRGPDLESATATELVAVAARLNGVLRRLGSGWAVFLEADRHVAGAYLESTWPDPVSWLVDEERRAAFEEGGEHFESSYFLTLLWLPPEEGVARAGRWLLERSAPRRRLDWRDQLQAFAERTDRLLQLLDGFMPEVAWLDDSETLTYLHGTVSTTRQRVRLPEVPMYLDALLPDQDLAGGLEPRLGNAHLRTLTVLGFPHSSFPGILDELNRLAFPYRWTTRWIALDKPDATRVLTRIRRQWFAKRKSVVTLLREIVFQQDSPLVDSDADNKAADADTALQALGEDLVAEGYVTATVTVWDEDAAIAEARLKAAEKILHGRDFTTITETLGAVEAWLSSLPGHVYANVRQPPVSSLNLAHMVPLSAVWAGPERNAHLAGPPLLVARTDGSTPFRLVLHQGDVGHALIIGPTGAGKSVLLNLLMLQFRRYGASRIHLFDLGGSARATVLALGGAYHQLSREGGELAFQPLADIDLPAERGWAAEWVCQMLAHEGVTVTPEVKEAVWSALASLAGAPVDQRTLTGLAALLPSNALKRALQPYTLAGPFGRLLDADRDTLALADIQGFEMQDLIHSPQALLPVLEYLFHRLEAGFDGSPTLLILGESWAFLDDATFAPRIREWLKTLRKKNVSAVFATQSLADVADSALAPAIAESCMSRIFLPNERAQEPRIRRVYESFGLNDRQIELIARATPKRDYYFQSRAGNRLFELSLGEVALAFAAAGSAEDHQDMDALEGEGLTGAVFAAVWLRRCGLGWAADLIDGGVR
ncbi:MAG: conjugal transfer protein TrbE [Bacteroidota bacterium]